MSGAPLSPADLSTALETYRETGNYSAAARAVDRDESTVRRALRRHAAPERAELFAAELAASQRNYLSACRKARRKVVAALDATTDPRDLAMLAHVLHEGLRAVSTARAAHARLVVADNQANGSPAFGRVVEYEDLSTLSDEELNARIATHAAELERLRADGATPTADQLHTRVAELARKACATDTDGLAEAVPTHARSAPVVMLPRLDGVPARPDGLTVYIPREEPP